MTLSLRQNEIINTALSLIADCGIQNFTIKNIATRLGITEPAIYRHFCSKSEIIKTLITSFDQAVATKSSTQSGFAAVVEFAQGRFQQVIDNPPLARVIFAEELFINDPEFSQLMLKMMHQHRDALSGYFLQAQERGEIRHDISLDMLFRLTFGPIRLLIKQWGISGGGFDLKKNGEELLNTLKVILK